MSTSKKISAFVLSEFSVNAIYGERERAQIRELTDLRDGFITRAVAESDPSALRDVQIIFSGWGAPVFDKKLLDAMPNLEAIFYGAGTIKEFTPPEFWERDIPITSSWSANGVPVAEFTEAVITLSLKRFWRMNAAYKSPDTFDIKRGIIGAYGAKVGLISLGMIGRMVAKRLQTHDLDVLAYDPFVTQEKADALGLGVTMISSLETMFAECDVVSLHAPNLPATRNMITRAMLASMKDSATFVNTARGAIVDEPAMLDVLAARPDLTAVIDVTFPEPAAKDSPMFMLPNIVLTPHIAGSMGDECRRMGQVAIDECRRFLAGEPLQWRVTREMAEIMA